MDPINLRDPLPPENPAGAAAVTQPRRITVSRIGLAFSCIALAMLAVLALLRPG